MKYTIDTQLDLLKKKYAYQFTPEQIAQILMQSILIGMNQGKVQYDNSQDLIDTIKELQRNKPVFKRLINVHLFDQEHALALYHEAIDINLVGIPHDVLGRLFEEMISIADAQVYGQFYTPSSLVKLLLDLSLSQLPKDDVLSVYDPTCGTGGLLIMLSKYQSQAFKYYGQEFNPTSWKIAYMNALIHKLDFDFGVCEGNTLLRPMHKDLKAHLILANPPYNQKDWIQDLDLSVDPRFKDCPKPPQGNGNFAWILHCLFHLKDDGIAMIVLANGSLSTRQKDELAIKNYLIQNNFIEAIISLPPKLFTNTSIPACVWVLKKNKTRHDILFIDLSDKAKVISKKLNCLDDKDIDLVSSKINAFRNNELLDDTDIFVVRSNDQVIENQSSLVPGQYKKIEMNDQDIDEETFMEKINRLFQEFERLDEEGKELSIKIRESLGSLRINK